MFYHFIQRCGSILFKGVNGTIPAPHTPQHYTSCHEVIREQDVNCSSLWPLVISSEAEWNCRKNEESWTISLGVAVTSYFISLGLSVLMVRKNIGLDHMRFPSSLINVIL